MATNCLDKIYCENAWGCDITVADADGNPIDPLLIRDGSEIVLILGDKPGYTFNGFCDENGAVIPYRAVPGYDNRYKVTANCNKQYISKYCAITYTINVTANPSNCLEPYITQAKYGDVVHIRANETGTCHFINWTQEGILVSEEREFDYVVTGNTHFVANYDSVMYLITAKPNNPNRGTCTGSGRYLLNTQVTISATPKKGFVFAGWADGYGSQNRQITVVGNKTYIANFIKKNNVVDATSVSGGAIIGSGEYATGEVVTLTAIPDAGWKFEYWIDGNDRIYDEKYSFIAEEDKTVTPHFTQADYSVSVVASPSDGGYFTPQPSSSYDYGDTFTVEAVPNSGYLFKIWSDGIKAAQRTVTVSSNISLTGLFEEQPTEYAIVIVLPDSTYSCQIIYGGMDIGNQVGNEVTAYATEGTVLVLSPSTEPGKILTEITDSDDNPIWERGETASKTLIRYTVENHDETLTATYETVECVMRVSAEPINTSTSGNISLSVTVDGTTTTFTPSTQYPVLLRTDIEYGTEITLSAPSTVGGYSFSHWVTDMGSYGSETATFGLVTNSKCIAVYEQTSETVVGTE